MLKVAADLRAEADFGLIAVLLRLFGLALFFFDASQPGSKHLPGLRAILMLAAFGLTLHGDARWQVRQPNGATRFVDMLPASAAGAKRVFANVAVVDINLYLIRDFRRDVDGCETGLSFAFRIERADANQPMNACFPFEVAVRHRAANRDRGAVDSGNFIVAAIE